ncbi:TetR/AcrR family transcriptional regulator [Actinoplanes auranticolor]|uniref:TetR family transcriptional regulator n=1 Tax=Actinoplanes auranticolor TaxID=47988 RepID=A0A919SD05_9ACTN|nr:TetR/AcrR family transcriptional regulator [Actinoplanes auranticolor]GIM69466.1 TetR family transcriptional regulator [Actinoplanes auranticolor]
MPRAGLSAAAVVEVALTLIDEKGPEALSLAAVADRAGVAAPSLYKHIGSLADLRELMALRVLRETTAVFTSVVIGRSRDDAVAALMRAFRAYVVEHPGRYALVPLDPMRRDDLAGAARELLDVFFAVLRGYGLDESAATHATRRIRVAAHGFAVIEAGGGFGLAEDVDTTFEQVIAMVLASLRQGSTE